MDKKSVFDKANISYVKNFKKWIYCPNCQSNKMTINKKTQMWECKFCDYQLRVKEWEDGYVFWFCDQCDTYLNIQDNFEPNSLEHTCSKCGHKNDISSDNIIKICKVCGKPLTKTNSTICIDCKKERNKKILKSLGAGAIAIGTVAVAVINSIGNNSDSENDVQDKNDGSRKYKLIFDGEEQDELYDSYEQADEARLYMSSCSNSGAETLNLSNPDNDYDEDADYEYEIEEV